MAMVCQRRPWFLVPFSSRSLFVPFWLPELFEPSHYWVITGSLPAEGRANSRFGREGWERSQAASEVVGQPGYAPGDEDLFESSRFRPLLSLVRVVSPSCGSCSLLRSDHALLQSNARRGECWPRIRHFFGFFLTLLVASGSGTWAHGAKRSQMGVTHLGTGLRGV
jgi:hypothetical protein